MNLAYKFRFKYMLLAKQPRQGCGMGNPKCEEKTEVKILSHTHRGWSKQLGWKKERQKI